VLGLAEARMVEARINTLATRTLSRSKALPLMVRRPRGVKALGCTVGSFLSSCYVAALQDNAGGLSCQGCFYFTTNCLDCQQLTIRCAYAILIVV